MSDVGISHRAVEGHIPIHGSGTSVIGHEYLKVGYIADGESATGGVGAIGMAMFNGSDKAFGNRINAGDRLIGSLLRRVRFDVRRVGNPPGVVTFTIRDSGGTIVETLGVVNTSDIVPANVENTRSMFDFPCNRVITAADRIMIEYDDAGSDVNNLVEALRSVIDVYPSDTYQVEKITASGTFQIVTSSRHMRGIYYVL